MQFSSEHQLYEYFCAKFLEMRSRISSRPLSRFLLAEDFAEYVERQVNGHNLYLIGEHHYSRKPVDITHESVVPKIESNPSSWLLLKEEGLVLMKNELFDPDILYFQGLARLFQLPYEDALESLYSTGTREYMRQQTGLTNEEIDRVLLEFCMTIESPEDMKDTRFLIRMAANLRRSREYVWWLLRKDAVDIDFGELGFHWNEYSKRRFHRLLEKYPDKTNVLANVGVEHLPVFNE